MVGLKLTILAGMAGQWATEICLSPCLPSAGITEAGQFVVDAILFVNVDCGVELRSSFMDHNTSSGQPPPSLSISWSTRMQFMKSRYFYQGAYVQKLSLLLVPA